ADAELSPLRRAAEPRAIGEARARGGRIGGAVHHAVGVRRAEVEIARQAPAQLGDERRAAPRVGAAYLGEAGQQLERALGVGDGPVVGGGGDAGQAESVLAGGGDELAALLVSEVEDQDE